MMNISSPAFGGVNRAQAFHPDDVLAGIEIDVVGQYERIIAHGNGEVKTVVWTGRERVDVVVEVIQVEDWNVSLVKSCGVRTIGHTAWPTTFPRYPEKSYTDPSRSPLFVCRQNRSGNL